MTRLYPQHELPQFENWPQRDGNKWTVELKANCTLHIQDDAGQPTDDQFQAVRDDCAVSASGSSPPTLSINALTPHQGGSRPLERWLPPFPHPRPSALTPTPSPVPIWNKANLTFISTNLACCWLLSGEQLDPQSFSGNILTNSLHHEGLQKVLFFFFIIFFCWSVVDLQYWVSFRCMAQGFSYTCT